MVRFDGRKRKLFLVHKFPPISHTFPEAVPSSPFCTQLAKMPPPTTLRGTALDVRPHLCCWYHAEGRNPGLRCHRVASIAGAPPAHPICVPSPPPLRKGTCRSACWKNQPRCGGVRELYVAGTVANACQKKSCVTRKWGFCFLKKIMVCFHSKRKSKGKQFGFLDFWGLC